DVEALQRGGVAVRAVVGANDVRRDRRYDDFVERPPGRHARRGCRALRRCGQRLALAGSTGIVYRLDLRLRQRAPVQRHLVDVAVEVDRAGVVGLSDSERSRIGDAARTNGRIERVLQHTVDVELAT